MDFGISEKAVLARLVGPAAADAEEVRVERSRPLITLVHVTSGRVGLPHLEQGIPNRRAARIQHATGDDDALPDRLAAYLKCEKLSLPISSSYDEFKQFLLSQ